MLFNILTHLVDNTFWSEFSMMFNKSKISSGFKTEFEANNNHEFLEA